jgi:hypothetical protein
MADDKGTVAVSQISCGSSHSCALLGTSELTTPADKLL